MDELAPDVWRVIGPDQRMPGGVRMPLVSTVIRLPDRSLALYSPVAFDAAQVAAIDAVGEVAHVIAPNLLHHLHAGAACAHWPRAILHAPPGLAAKRPELAIARTLGTDAEPAWRDALAIEVIGGAPTIAETVVFHRATGTLVCADLVFHVTSPANLRTRMTLALMGIGGGRLGASRVWRFLVRDRAAARASIDRILDWPIARVAPTHGEPAAMDSAALAGRVARAYRGRPARALPA